jgi:hypothetical protein
MQNPYAPYLRDRDPVDVIAATPRRLRNLAHALGAAGMQRARAPGKWTAREILCHLADCEIGFAFRLRQTLAEDHHVMQPFDQNLWARPYAAYDAASALAVFTALREWNLTLIRAVIPAALAKPVSHPERGDMTFKVILETMGGHDLNHLHQLDETAAA